MSTNNQIWVEYKTDDNRLYYYNKFTKQTQWQIPPDLHASTSTSTSASAAAHPSMVVPAPPVSAVHIPPIPSRTELHLLPSRKQDPMVASSPVAVPALTPVVNQQLTPSFSKITPTPVPILAPKFEPLSKPHASPTPAVEDVWEEYQNDDGIPYYYNKITQTSSWEMPPGFKSKINSSIEGETRSDGNASHDTWLGKDKDKENGGPYIHGSESQDSVFTKQSDDAAQLPILRRLSSVPRGSARSKLVLAMEVIADKLPACPPCWNKICPKSNTKEKCRVCRRWPRCQRFWSNRYVRIVTGIVVLFLLIFMFYVIWAVLNNRLNTLCCLICPGLFRSHKVQR